MTRVRQGGFLLGTSQPQTDTSSTMSQERPNQLADLLKSTSHHHSTQDTEAIVEGLFKRLSESSKNTPSTPDKADKLDELTQSIAFPSLTRQAISTPKACPQAS